MSGEKAIEVDVSGVRDFATDLRAQLDGRLSHDNDAIRASFLSGATFGERSASPVVQQVVRDYYRRLGESLELLDALLHNGAVLVEVATAVVEAYEQADTMSGSELQTLLTDANQRVLAAERADQEADRRWRL